MSSLQVGYFLISIGIFMAVVLPVLSFLGRWGIHTLVRQRVIRRGHDVATFDRLSRAHPTDWNMTLFTPLMGASFVFFGVAEASRNKVALVIAIVFFVLCFAVLSVSFIREVKRTLGERIRDIRRN